ncbi:MAG: DUF5916 domain-containing protein [Candidatus Krumholzibacteria bacterium]
MRLKTQNAPRFLSIIVVVLIHLAVLSPSAPFARPDGGGYNDSSTGDLPKFTPNSTLDFIIPRITSRPTIDGKLDEVMWQRAAKLTNFVEVTPGDNVEPAVQTDVLLAYDDENIYVAFVCHDEDVAGIRATVTDRDNIGRDDFAGIMFDTFNDRQNSYEFYVNPYGIQYDQRRSKGGGEDDSFDTVWQSAGEINSTGWTAELAIPFRSLRFPNVEEQEWGVHALRIRPRSSREQHSWAPLSRDESCLFCQAGTMTGITGVNSGRKLEILPYAISDQVGRAQDIDDPTSAFQNDDANVDGGVGIKYGLTTNLTLDGTINPDFSQVESDEAQISLNLTSAIFLDEKRPFFLEGADIFRSKVRTVHTRTLNDPKAAGKVTGKAGKYTVGFISAQDDNTSFPVPFEEGSSLVFPGESVSNILRVKRDVLDDSFVGLMVTDRRYTDAGGSASNFGIDYDLRLKEKYRFNAQVMGSHTREPNNPSLSDDFNGDSFGPRADNDRYTSDFDGESFFGHAIAADFNREARHWNFGIYYEDSSPTFRADNGFVFANNFRLAGMWNEMTFQPDNRILDVVEPGFNIGREFNYDGKFKDEWIEPQLFMKFKKQTQVFASYLWSQEDFRDVHIKGIRRLFFEVETDFTRFLTAEGWIRQGRSIFRSASPFLASSTSMRLRAELKPTSQIKFDTIYLIIKFAKLPGRPGVPHAQHKQYSVRNKLTYQLNKRLFLRLVGEYRKDSGGGATYDLDPLISYKINPFTVFFAGSTHDFLDYEEPGFAGNTGFRQTQRTFFVKFQYLFRV